MPPIRLDVHGWPVRVDCTDPRLVRLARALYGRFPPARRPEQDVFELTRSARGASFHGRRASSGASVRSRDEMPVLSWLDDQLTIGAQETRPDLLFVHAAALGRNGRALLLCAESGGGKSTTSWAALHHGFALLSDELAPVDPRTLLVHPHPRGVCLKDRPPRPYVLPRGTMRHHSGFIVPVPSLPRPVVARALPLQALVFVSYRPDLTGPALRPIGPAESAARLYANALNALAHPSDGLDPVTALSERVPAFVLLNNDLPAACALLARLLPRRPARRRA